jgi:alcohol dehydrogenase
MIARALGAQVIAVDIKDESLKLARKLGAVATINASGNNDTVEQVKTLSHGGVHVSIDALGSDITCYNSVSNLRKRGKHIQVGLMIGKHKNAKVPMDKVLADELEIIGSHGMQAYKYPDMLEMIKNGKLQPEKLIEKTISLQEATTALPAMKKFDNKGVWVINSF